MADIIEFDNTPDNKYRLALKRDNVDPETKLAIQTLEALPQDAANAIAKLFFSSVIIETKVALGLIEEDPPHLTMDDTPIYDKIVELQEQVAKNCYFCDKTVDTNEEGFGHRTKLCPWCAEKLANYRAFLDLQKGPDDQIKYMREPMKNRIRRDYENKFGKKDPL